jgi:O-antigen/teichoic acid export membrane protein
MDNPISFAVSLLFGTVLLVGLIACAGWLYRAYRNTTCLSLNQKCHAKIATALGTVLLVALMARGMPHRLDSMLDLLGGIAYMAVAFAGVGELCVNRKWLCRWLRKRFEP